MSSSARQHVTCLFGRAAAGRLDAEVLSVTRRVGELLQKLPRDINPVNLEELRRIKQTLVELENKVRCYFGNQMCLVILSINPVNLEELRRIKQTLVELENKVLIV